MEILLDPGMIIVLIMRLLGPLLIFRWPLLGTILSQYVFDMFDVVIWDAMGTLEKIDYTCADKPLDLYQLSIQAIVAFRWKQAIPKKICLWLFAYRCLGFAVYEIVRDRIVFLIFPNLFFVFFLFYLIALKFNVGHWFEKKKSLLWIMLLILLIKIPQEYFLHFVEKSPWEMLKLFGG